MIVNSKFLKTILTGFGILVVSVLCARPPYYVAAYVWPSCHDEPMSRNALWPEGLGEWEVIRKGNPRFEGHYQPKQPFWGYEQDNDPKVVEKWIDVAVEHGVNVFIYDWYWYDEGPYLESALNDGFLKARNNEKMNFYVMWANHDVPKNYWNYHRYKDDKTLLWNACVDWKNYKIIVERLIRQYFSKPNYLKIDGCPVFSIFSVDKLLESFGGSVEESRKALDYFRDEVKKAGFPGLYIQWNQGGGSLLSKEKAKQFTERVKTMGFDGVAMYNMGGFNEDYIIHGTNSIKIREQLDSILNIPLFPCVSVGWDDTPRFPEKGIHDVVHYNNTPQSFALLLQKAKDYVDRHPGQPKIITINAWNEWVEGSYLLPDMLNGFGYLEAVKEVIKKEVHHYTILPEPQQIEYATGAFEIKDKLSIAFPKELANEATLMSRYFADDFSIQSILQKEKKSADVTLSLDKSVLPEHLEGYVLDIKPNNISIKANTPAGILYGIQTLRQLGSVETHGRTSLPACTITDYPALVWRAFMLDESRHFFGKEVVYKLLDNMSRLKMNIFHWHLIDDQGWRIEIKKYPELTKTGAFRGDSNPQYGGFYTQDEIKEIIAYAAARHITIVPEVEMPGHSAAAIASYPWLGSTGKIFKVPSGWGLSGVIDVFNVTDPKVLDFLKDVLNEVIALFPGNVLHIGGDEVNYDFWRNSPAISQYMEKNGIQTPADLQIDFTNRMSQWLVSKNRRMMGWNEITGMASQDWQSAGSKKPEQQLAKGTVVHFWHGDSALIKKTIEAGYDIVNSYRLLTYLDLYKKMYVSLQKAYSFNPVPEGLTAEQQKKVLGLGCQMWSELVPDEQTLNKKVYPRIAAYAECGWTTPDKKDYNRFLNALDYFLTIWKNQGIEYEQINININK